MSQEISPHPEPDRLYARFWQSASGFWRGRRSWFAWSLSALLVMIVLLQLLVQYLLNWWNRDFFDAIGRRDGAALWAEAQIFLPLATASIALAALSVWGRMTAQRKWRESLSRHLIEYWLMKDHFRRLNDLVSGPQNPEYRIAEDVRIATDAPIDLVLALLTSVLTAITFFSVLWSVGGDLAVNFVGRELIVPGYLVLGVIVYSTVCTTAMIVIGRHLADVIQEKNQAEAEFRAAADRLREAGHAGAPTDNYTAERRALWVSLLHVLGHWRDFCWQLVRTTLISHGNFLLAPVVAWLLCVPKYVSGAMTLGELTQAAAAFVTVQGAFNWTVDNYQRLADWRSSVHRVAVLLLALDELDQAPQSASAEAPASAKGLEISRTA